MHANLSQFLTHDFPQRLALAKFKEPMRLQLLVPGHTELRTHYELKADGVSWSAGLADAGAQVTVAIQMPELQALVDGTLDATEALGLGRIQVFGDEGASTELGRMLATNALWEG
jgi:hypothetical protein